MIEPPEPEPLCSMVLFTLAAGSEEGPPTHWQLEIDTRYSGSDIEFAHLLNVLLKPGSPKRGRSRRAHSDICSLILTTQSIELFYRGLVILLHFHS